MTDAMPPEIPRSSIPDRVIGEKRKPPVSALKQKGLSRRSLLIKAAKLATVIGLSSLIGPGPVHRDSQSIIPETPKFPKTKEFTDPTILQIQEFLDSSTEDVEIRIKGSVKGGPLHVEKIPRPAREGVPPGETSEMVALAIKGTESKKRQVVLKGDENTPVSFDINGAAYGIFCENASITIENFAFHGGKSHKSGAPEHFGAENAYIYGSDSTVNVYKTTIDGTTDELASTPIIVDGKQTGEQPTGLTGIYLRNCTDCHIIEAKLINTSWDAITCNGSDVSIYDCTISGLRDGVKAGGGVGITSEMVLTEEEDIKGRKSIYESKRHGKVEINQTTITGKYKGVDSFDDNDVSVYDCTITCNDSAEAINSYGIWLGNDGRQSVVNSTINGKSGLIEVDAYADNYEVRGNNLNYNATNDMGWVPNSRLEDRAIVVRRKTDAKPFWEYFTGNKIVYHGSLDSIRTWGLDALMSPNPAENNEEWQACWRSGNVLTDLDQNK